MRVRCCPVFACVALDFADLDRRHDGGCRVCDGVDRGGIQMGENLGLYAESLDGGGSQCE